MQKLAQSIETFLKININQIVDLQGTFLGLILLSIMYEILVVLEISYL